MIVVKRSQVGKPQPFNAVLVTEWPEQMTHCAFMITEDDVVWRGQLSSRWIDANSNIVGHFGDVDLTFEVMEY